jgi:hypothetical protein
MLPIEIEPVLYVYHRDGGCRYKVSIIDNAGVEIEYEEAKHSELAITWERVDGAGFGIERDDLQNMITVLSMFAEWLGEKDD